MEAVYKPGIVFRFRGSKNIAGRNPSKKMTEALRCLAESDEMQPFLSEAHAVRRDVVLDVFHSRDGHPLLIHIAAAPSRASQERAAARRGVAMGR